MKRVLVLVVVLTLVGSGIAFAIADSGESPAVAVARVDTQSTAVSFNAMLTATEPIGAATPASVADTHDSLDPTDAATVQATVEPYSRSDNADGEIVPLPSNTPVPAFDTAEKVSQDALAAVKQLLASPQAQDLDALVGAIKAIDAALARIETLGLTLNQQQTAEAALLLARAHLSELLTQVATDTHVAPTPTPAPRLRRGSASASDVQSSSQSTSGLLFQQLLQGLEQQSKDRSSKQNHDPSP